MVSSPQSSPQPSPQPSLLADLADELIRVGRRREAFVPQAGLETSAFKILWVLATDGRERTLRELAEALGLELSTINRQVNAAIRAGLLDRHDVPGSTSRVVRPTPRGQELFEADRSDRAAFLRQILDHMGESAALDLIRGLRAFNDAYEAIHE